VGRIEDALHKIQNAGRRPGSEATRAAAPETRLASVVAREHEYTGKRIVVDVAELAKNGLLAPGPDERRLAEQYRVIKRPLVRNASAARDPPLPRGNLLMVASALAGEGKTFTCVNLCLSIARERDWDVVLVDADCSKPHLTRLFAAEQERGLIDLLRDPSLRFESVVMPTDVPGLSLLPAGTRDEHASELLASKRMDELCASLAAAAGRIIVFDSSPLLLTSEAGAVAMEVGQIVVVVRANETPRGAVLAALEKLDSSKAVACILNQGYGSLPGLEYGGYGDYGDYGDYGSR
jgi:exopolysaccharide/PEP-CTERM locus tyrosine autokinase